MTLHTLARVETEDGDVEYADTYEAMLYRELPSAAVHNSKAKRDYWLVDMEPKYPPYCVAVRDSNGNPRKAFNQFDAQGYYTYAVDDRLKKAEQAVGADMKPRREIDVKRTITVALCAVIVLLVVWRFLS